MNLFAIKNIAIIVCDDAKRIKNKLRENGYASIEGRGGKLVVLNVSKNILERMCRYNDMSIEGYLMSDNDDIDNALHSADIPTEELHRVENAIYQNAAAAAESRGASWADAEALIEWTIDHYVGYFPYYLRRKITKGL